MSELIGSIQTESGKNCLESMKSQFRSLRAFLERHPDSFVLGATLSTPFGFEYNITANPLKIADLKATLPVDLQPSTNFSAATDLILQKIMQVWNAQYIRIEGNDVGVLLLVIQIYANLPVGQAELSNRDLGRALNMIQMEHGKSALEVVKGSHYCIRSFLGKFPDVFSIGQTAISKTGYEYLISVDPKLSAPYKEKFNDALFFGNCEVTDFYLREVIKVS